MEIGWAMADADVNNVVLRGPLRGHVLIWKSWVPDGLLCVLVWFSYVKTGVPRSSPEFPGVPQSSLEFPGAFGATHLFRKSQEFNEIIKH